MGKKKQKSGKLPREVLGVKLPKELRRAGDALIEKARSPEGRQLLAAGLGLAASALAAAAERRREERPREPAAADRPEPPTPPRPPSPPPPFNGAASPTPGDALGLAINGAVDAFMKNMLSGRGGTGRS